MSYLHGLSPDSLSPNGTHVTSMGRGHHDQKHGQWGVVGTTTRSMGRGHHDQTHGQWGVIPDLESNTGHGIATTSNGGQGGVGHGVATTSTRILAMIPPCPLTTFTHFITLLRGSKMLTHIPVLCTSNTCFNLLTCMCPCLMKSQMRMIPDVG